VVPLSRQVAALLRELQLLTGHRALLFPHRMNPRVPISENTVNALIGRAGYGEALTAHGLRSLFSTICNDRQFAAPDVIEFALAHVERSRTKRAYDRGDRLILRGPDAALGRPRGRADSCGAAGRRDVH
jgi:integrase